MKPAFFRPSTCHGAWLGLAILALLLGPSPAALAAAGRQSPGEPQAVGASVAAPAADRQDPSVAELAKLVAAQAQALEAHTQALEAQQREIWELRKQLDETQTILRSARERVEQLATAAAPPIQAESVEARLAGIEQALRNIPDLPTDVVSAGSFPGSIAVPGTDSAIRVAGLVRTTGVASLGPLGTEDRFVTSSIPVEGSVEAGKESRFVLSSVPSRFNIDVRTPTGVGAMRAFIEGDFASGTSRALRLRHAYGQWKGLVVGQTWSTFADPMRNPTAWTSRA